ncbi:hypothetical protein KOW79_022752 [Hemibagrus wyckioides]|uniref:Immunoglobulin domain-containing protein n=1 Tax=Hemibagrus wyckioides TaxID=337641 RepID=A0A9D3S7N1_9TELE|nr:hypothetical protein KOW79_022752 [Hemibagrus wyckioides]
MKSRQSSKMRTCFHHSLSLLLLFLSEIFSSVGVSSVQEVIGAVGQSVTFPISVPVSGTILYKGDTVGLVLNKQSEINSEKFQNRLHWVSQSGFFTLSDLRTDDSGLYTVHSTKELEGKQEYQLEVYVYGLERDTKFNRREKRDISVISGLVFRKIQSGCKSHDTTTITDKRFYQQREIGNLQAQVLQRSQSAESSLKDLKKAIHLIKTSAQTTLDQSEKIFMDLILSAERKRSEIRDMVKATKEAEVQRAVDMLHCVEQEVTTLRKRDKDLVQLAQLNDDFLFVRTFMFLSDLSSCGDVPQVTVNLSPFKELQSSLERFSITGLDTQPRSANRCHMVQTSVPIIREDFLQCKQL